jgi:DNA-directed RNA polymerase subunit RPC12/RpoP
MKCANCGNDNHATLWDEGDTIYCSVCTHRTRKTDFADDSIQCPYCHRLRDKKAMYCRYCNSSDWTPSTPAEFAEIDKILKDMGY